MTAGLEFQHDLWFVKAKLVSDICQFRTSTIFCWWDPILSCDGCR